MVAMMPFHTEKYHHLASKDKSFAIVCTAAFGSS